MVSLRLPSNVDGTTCGPMISSTPEENKRRRIFVQTNDPMPTNPLKLFFNNHTQSTTQSKSNNKNNKRKARQSLPQDCVGIMNMTWPMNMLIVTGIDRDRAHTPEYYSNHHTHDYMATASIIYMKKKKIERGKKRERKKCLII